jgi:hypothetical protein
MLTRYFVLSIGDSTKGFDETTVSNMIAFLWAFEPQLNSLHPMYRQNQTWGQSMREASTYAMEYRKKYGRRPHPLTGVLHFLKGKSMYNLTKDAAPDNNGSANVFKYCAYSFQGLANNDFGFHDSKPTIEFRQHAATMDTEAIVNWIETSVGIVEHIRKIDNATLLDLLRIVEHESWEKLGDGKDDEREALLGPILAESNFTIIDLLQAMELYGPADYYRNRWRKLPKRAPSLWNIPKPDIIWEYEELLDPEAAEFRRTQRLRENWEADRIASEAQPEGGWKFDPDHPSWPAHRNRDLFYAPRLNTVHEFEQEKGPSGRASFGSDVRHSAAGDEASNASIPLEMQSFRPLHLLNFTSKETEEVSEEDTNSSAAASIPNHPKPPPSSPPFHTFSNLSFGSVDASSHPDAAALAALDAESASLDRELSAYEPLTGADPQTEDRLWRERVRYGRYSERDRFMYNGDGVLARGCRDPFDESLPRKGRKADSPQVSPKSKILTVKDEQEEEEGSGGARQVCGKPVPANKEGSDGEMPVSPRTVPVEEGESDGELPSLVQAMF